jgi:predicted O-methyltransferase YrrM
MELASRTGFSRSCAPEVGRLLRVLAAQHGQGTIAEIGTGCGVGAAWIVDGLSSTVNFVTVELDAARATAVAELFSTYANVRVLSGDWKRIRDYAPFVLVFDDAADAKTGDPTALVEMMSPGGLVVMDNLTPHHLWTPEQRGQYSGGDPIRQFWLGDARVIGVEVPVTAAESVMLATVR